MRMRGRMYADESRTGNTRDCILLRLGLKSTWFIFLIVVAR